MDYTVQEIRFTAEDYVRCVDLFYYLKAKGKNISYDSPITSIDSCGIDFNGDFYNYKLSEEVLDALGALDGKSDMTVGKLLKRLKYVLTHAIYPLYEVSAKAMTDKAFAKLCPNFTTHELLQGNSFKGFLDFLSMCYDAYTFFVDGDDYAKFSNIDMMFLDNIGYAYKDTHPHISQAIDLYVIYYNRHLVKNHTYSFLEQICHAITFNSETMDGDVECIADNDFTFNRGYREITISLDQYIDIDNTPVVNANMDARGYVISNILVKMLDYLKVLGATWYCHTRFTHSIAMLVMMSELMYHPKDYVFYDYSVTQSFDFISNEYISDEEDDVLMCKGSMLPSFGLYTLDTLREKTGFRSLEYVLSARKGLLTIMNGITKQLQGVHDEVEDIELVHDMNNYDKFFTLKLTYHNGDITTRDVYVDGKEWDNVYDYILASENDDYKYLALFNTKMALYTFKTHVNSMLHLIDRVGKTYELYNKNHDDMHLIKNRLNTLMDYVYKDYAVRKKEEKSRSVGTADTKEVETEDTTQSTDIVLTTLQNMSSKVNVKDIARVLATEYMIHGYDFLDMEDGTLYVYTTYGETKEVIPSPLHRFFTYVGNINKLPLLYYLID